MGWTNFNTDKRIRFNTLEAAQSNSGRKPIREEVQRWLADAYNFLNIQVTRAKLQTTLQDIIPNATFIKEWTSRHRDEWILWDN